MGGSFEFRDIDILGKDFMFNIDNRSSYKTGLGGVFTILLILVPLISGIVFGLQVIEREQPTFISSKRTLNAHPFVTLSNQNFLFGMRVADNTGKYIDDTSFVELIAAYDYGVMDQNKNMVIETRSLGKMHRCNETDYANLFSTNASIRFQQLSSYYCAKIDKLDVGGSWGENTIGLLYFQAKLCDSNTELKYGIKCKTPAERVNTYGDTFYVEYKFVDNVLDPKYFNALASLVKYDYKIMETSLSKRVKITYSTGDLTTDVGYFTYDNITNYFMQVEQNTLDIFKTKSDNVIFQAEIEISDVYNEYVRNYKKFQDVTGTVGGLTSMFYYFFTIVYYLYVENHMRYFLYDKLLDLKIDSDKIPDETKKAKKIESESHNEGDQKYHANDYSYIYKDEVDTTYKKIFSNQKEVETGYEENETNKDNREKPIEKADPTKFRSEVAYKNRISLAPEFKKDLKKAHDNKMKNDFTSDNIYHPIQENNLKEASKNLEKISDKEVGNRWFNPSFYHQFLRINDKERYEKLISYQKKPRYAYIYSKTRLFNHRVCNSCLLSCQEKKRNLRNITKKLLVLAETSLDSTLDGIKMLKKFEEFKFIKKILLCEEQAFMLSNIAKTQIFLSDENEKIEQKSQRKEKLMLPYLNKHYRASNVVGTLDKLLFEAMDDKLKNKLWNEVEESENTRKEEVNNKKSMETDNHNRQANIKSSSSENENLVRKETNLELNDIKNTIMESSENSKHEEEQKAHGIETVNTEDKFATKQ